MLFSRLIKFALYPGLLFLLITCTPVRHYIRDDAVLTWEPEIRVFDSLNAVERAGPEILLFTGSSSIRLWDSIHSDMAPYQVMQRGYGGANLSDFNYYAERVIPPQTFKAIVVFVANDIRGADNDRTPGEVFRLYRTLVSQVRERNPGTPMFWIETTPTPSRWNVWPEVVKANDQIRDYCRKNQDLYFIGTADAFLTAAGRPDSAFFRNDMLHLDRKGYTLWSGMIKDALGSAGIQP